MDLKAQVKESMPMSESENDENHQHLSLTSRSPKKSISAHFCHASREAN